MGSGEWFATVRTVRYHSPLPTPQPCIRKRHIPQRQRETGDAASVDRHTDLLRRHIGVLAHGFQAALLHRMLGARIELRKHAGVFAGAVRVDRRQAHAARLVVSGDRLGQRPMRPAQQVTLRAADATQEVADQRHLGRLARMRRARERQVLPAQSEPLHRPIFDQRHGLKRLGGRSPERPVLGVARARHETARAVDDGYVDGVAGFQNWSPPGFDQQSDSFRPRSALRNAEFGMRNVRAGVVPRTNLPFDSAFRIPHSALELYHPRACAPPFSSCC